MILQRKSDAISATVAPVNVACYVPLASPAMKSIFLSSLRPGSKSFDRFQSGLKVVLALPDSTLERLCNDLPTISELRVQGRIRSFIDSQLHELSISRSEARAVVDHVFAPLIESLGTRQGKKDSAEVIVEDLVARKLASPRQAKKLLAVVRQVESIAPRVHEIERRAQWSVGLMPTFTGAWTTVELRALFDRPYRGRDLATYEPKVVDAVPVASIQIEIDGDEEVSFQCDDDDLDFLIKRLTATQRELRAFQWPKREGGAK